MITMEWPRRYLSIALPHNYPLWCVIAFRPDIICYNLPGCHTTYSLRTIHLLLFISTPEIHRETSKTNRMPEEGILRNGGWYLLCRKIPTPMYDTICTTADLQLNEWRQEKETMQRERETNDDQLHLCISLLITNCRRLLYHFLHLNSCIYPLPNEYTPFNCHYRLRQTVNKVINIIGKLLSDLLILCTASPPVDRSIDSTSGDIV